MFQLKSPVFHATKVLGFQNPNQNVLILEITKSEPFTSNAAEGGEADEGKWRKLIFYFLKE